MKVYIYRSSKKEGLYVYLKDKDALATLPEPVARQLGTPEFAMEIDLLPSRKLSQEDAVTVIENLESQGFHLQMPRDVESLIEEVLVKK